MYVFFQVAELKVWHSEAMVSGSATVEELRGAIAGVKAGPFQHLRYTSY